jgi:DNA topoisomerase IB
MRSRAPNPQPANGRVAGKSSTPFARPPPSLANTPAICRKSYVHETVVNAFEDGVLERFAETLRTRRSTAKRAKVLAKVAAQVETDGAAV